jgi:RHS repeat-associated protein
MDAAGALTAVNTWGSHGLLARRSGGSSVFYAFDPQGSVAQRLDAGANVLTSHMFDAHGVGLSTAPTSDPYGYKGQWGYYRDTETGLLLLTHRYLDVGAGRFLNRDPTGYAGGLNLYAYVANSPVKASDPMGLARWIIIPRFPQEEKKQIFHHAYLVFDRINCIDGTAFGFWEGGITKHDPGLRNPHPRKWIIRRDRSVKFEEALCRCIQRSIAKPPRYDKGYNPFTHFNCNDWVRTMWNCAFTDAYWSDVSWIGPI